MSLENVRYGRVFQAVLVVIGASLVLSFLTACLMLPLMSQDMVTRFSDLLKTMTNPDVPQDQLNQQVEDLTRDFGPQLNLQYIMQWTLAVLITFWAARRTSRQAESPEQAMGYGILIGLGVAFSYGLFCVLLSIAFFLIRVLFFGFIFAAGYLGGRAGGRNLIPLGTAIPPLLPGFRRPGPATAPSVGNYLGTTTGENPDTFFNMGVMAALGGRRDEARQHFTRVLQMQPRHVPAWLQLANLSDTPEQAWNYIQQARSISPTDPAVIQAVEVIWPQVAANAARQGPPRAQAPYPGAAASDSPVLRSTLPPDAGTPVPGETGSHEETPVPPPPSITPPPSGGEPEA